MRAVGCPSAKLHIFRTRYTISFAVVIRNTRKGPKWVIAYCFTAISATSFVLTLGVCVLYVRVRALKEKPLKLSTPNLEHIAYDRISSCVDSKVKRSNDKGHWVVKCAAGVGMQVDMTA